jgi:hypothetical protein
MLGVAAAQQATEQQYDLADALHLETLDISESLLKAAETAFNNDHRYTCLNSIRESMAPLSYQLQMVVTLLGISGAMADPGDVEVVAGYIGRNAPFWDRQLLIVERGINSNAARCASDRLVVSKANSALQLTGRAKAFFRSLKEGFAAQPGRS